MLLWVTFLNFRGYSGRTEIPEENMDDWMPKTDRNRKNTKIKNPYKHLKINFPYLHI